MATRDLWHLSFARLITQRAPPSFEVRAEVQLSSEPQRADLILLRRKDVPPRDEEAQVLRALWPHLGPHALVEFKSPVKGFRKTDLLRLMSYGAQYHVLESEAVWGSSDLTLVLVIPSRNGALDAELDRMGWTLTLLGAGYGRIDGAVYTVFVAFTDEVAEAEADDFLQIFSHIQAQTRAAAWWWQQWTAKEAAMEDVKNLEGYDEMLEKFLGNLTLAERLTGLRPEELLSGLKPEQRLTGLRPEDRLVDLAPEQQILALADPVLRGFSEEYLRSLPIDVQDAVRKRIGRPSNG